MSTDQDVTGELIRLSTEDLDLADSVYARYLVEQGLADLVHGKKNGILDEGGQQAIDHGVRTNPRDLSFDGLSKTMRLLGRTRR